MIVKYRLNLRLRYKNIMQENNRDADVFHVNGVRGHKFGAESDNKNLIPFQRFY